MSYHLRHLSNESWFGQAGVSPSEQSMRHWYISQCMASQTQGNRRFAPGWQSVVFKSNSKAALVSA